MPREAQSALSERESELTYDERLWLIRCDRGHEWVGAPDTVSYFACPQCGQDEGCEGQREVPDGTPITGDASG